jgi:hypothetical protein
MTMKAVKGVVKNNVVVLEEGVHVPDGTEVEVRLPSASRKRKEAFLRVLRNPITRHIGMDEIIEEDKREREERWNFEGPDRQ